MEYMTMSMKMILNQKKSKVYLNRLSGLVNSILGNKSFKRPKI